MPASRLPWCWSAKYFQSCSCADGGPIVGTLYLLAGQCSSIQTIPNLNCQFTFDIFTLEGTVVSLSLSGISNCPSPRTLWAYVQHTNSSCTTSIESALLHHLPNLNLSSDMLGRTQTVASFLSLLAWLANQLSYFVCSRCGFSGLPVCAPPLLVSPACSR